MDSAKKVITRLAATLAVIALVVLIALPVIGHIATITSSPASALAQAPADYHSTDDSSWTVDGKKVSQQAPQAISEMLPAPKAASYNQPQIKYTTIQDRSDTLDRHPVLMENSSAHNPSYQELMTFLDSDNTVQHKYDYPNYTCANFAVELQHNAESLGINCGYAGMNFMGKDDGHAISVFPTTDAGLVYVDLTGGKRIISKNLKEGMKYYNMGVIDSLNIYW